MRVKLVYFTGSLLSDNKSYLIRHHNPMAMQHAHFELADIMEPTKVLCKVDNVLQAMRGHVGVESGDLEVR